MRPIAVALVVLCARYGGKGGGPGDGETDGDVPVVLDWDEEDLPFRVTVTLEAHDGRDRTDVPVMARIDHGDMYVMRDVRVHKVGGGEVEGDARCQPDGRAPEVGFTAEGTTRMGETRTFLVYYDVAGSPRRGIGRTAGPRSG
jgi:hypothetical protein